MPLQRTYSLWASNTSFQQFDLSIFWTIRRHRSLLYQVNYLTKEKATCSFVLLWIVSATECIFKIYQHTLMLVKMQTKK